MAFDAGGALVLARDKTTGLFVDKTLDVVSLEQSGRQYSVRFRGGRFPFTYNPENLVVCAPSETLVVDDALVEVRGAAWPAARRLEHFDTLVGSWTRVHYDTRTGPAFRTYPSAEVGLAANARRAPRSQLLMEYFERVVAAHDEDDPLRRAFGRLQYVHPDSALAAFLEGAPIAPDREPVELVFPFSSNLSQREALDVALRHRISVIEGPPGTGKTETILNLIANIVRDPAATVGVVSASNAAVDNVYEKLTRRGFGFIAAPLGSVERRDAFLEAQGSRAVALEAFLALRAPDPALDGEIAQLSAEVHRVYSLERETAQIRTTLAAVRREAEVFDGRQDAAASSLLPPVAARWPAPKLLELLADLDLAQRGTARLRWAIRRRWRYRLGGRVDTASAEFSDEVQRRYFASRVLELERRLEELESALSAPATSRVRDGLSRVSLNVFSAALRERYADRRIVHHTADSLWRDRDALARDYPVLLSTCHSLPSAVGPGRLLDYLIIDEASQVNLAIAVLAMSYARRVIVVGDIHQLAHIAQDVGGLGMGGELEAYDYSRHSILSSLMVLYGDALPRTMLREHYRCDPRIIEFCNRLYYGGQLIAMAPEGAGEALALLRTAPGSHHRSHSDGGHTNEREVDVIEREVLPLFASDVTSGDVGVVTPFRRHADLVGSRLPGVEADTVHKFQGREKRAMVLSSVLDRTHSGTRLAQFLDDPRMINVAVSRAQERLVVVANPELPEECRDLQYLVEYVEQRSPGQVRRSDIVSVFDVLYSEYAEVLRGFSARLRGRTPYRSEEAALVMLEELLGAAELQHLRLHYQVPLRNLVAPGVSLSPDERTFVGRRSSVDFVVSNRVTERALGVIEVDGFAFHEDSPEQLRRDALKDAVLAKSGIALLRLPTTGSGERERAAEFLRELAGHRAAGLADRRP